MKINDKGKTWFTVKKGAVISYNVFNEDGQVIDTKYVLTEEDICVYMESENVSVEELN